MSENENCPNCGELIKESGFNQNPIISEKKIEIINEFREKKRKAYCKNCGERLYEATKKHINEQIDYNNKFLKKKILMRYQ